MRRSWNSDGVLVQRPQRYHLNNQERPLQRNVYVRYRQPYSQNLERYYNDLPNNRNMLERYPLIEDRNQQRPNLILKAMVCVLITMILTSFFDQECEEVLQKNLAEKCLDSFVEKGCEDSNRHNKQCSQLQKCLSNPTGYAKEKENKKWNKIIEDIKQFSQIGGQRLWWLSLISFVCLIIFLFKQERR